jgi:hypothetical protein
MRIFALLALLPVAVACSSSSSGSSGGTCDSAWSKAAAACSAANSMQQMQLFLAQCNNPTQLAPGCGMQATALADCVKNASSFTCDMNGQPHAAGCDSQESAVGTCLIAGLSDAGLTTD